MTEFIMNSLVRVDQNGGEKPTAVLAGTYDGVEYDEWFYSKKHNPAIYDQVESLIDAAIAEDTVYVAPDPIIPDTPENRRLERAEEFSQTLDKLNAAWWDSLTDTEKTEVNTYRASWLDYPSTGVKPTRPSIFN